MSEYVDITYEKRGRVGILTLNRPEKLNALRPSMEGEMRRCWSDFNRDPEARALVVTGAGRGFCTGEDVGVLREILEEHSRPGVTPQRASAIPQDLIEMVEKPVIAAVNGPAAGAGFGLALAADIRIAAQSAAFHCIYLRRGLVCSCEVWFLPRLMHLGPAVHKILLGETISAKEALQYSLVSELVPDARLVERAMELGERLAAGPPSALKFTKKAIQRALVSDLRSSMDYVSYLRGAASSEEADEGGRALLENRAPRW
jgi:enoyl-CoA hydratase/carnithine racemase